MLLLKIYTIIGGVNGTGKTSLTGVLKADRSDLGYIIDVDRIAAENNNDIFLAGRFAIKKIDELLERQISFTQETTLSGHKTLKTILEARNKAYYIRLYYIGLNTVEESLKRIKNRVEKGGHDVSGSTVLNRFNNRFQSLIKVIPYCNEIHLFDNENGFVEVAEIRNSDIIYKNNCPPQWFEQLKAELMH